MGYCTLAIQYLDIINTTGLASALIARKDKFEEAANAAYFASITLGLVSFGISWFSAPFVANFFHEPAVTNLFRALSVSLPISSLGLVSSAYLSRHLQFRKKVMGDLGRTLLKGLASIILALAGWGPWSSRIWIGGWRNRRSDLYVAFGGVETGS